MYVVCGLFLLATVFPYTQIVPSSGYTQPYAMLLGSMIFLMRFTPICAAMSRHDRWALFGLALLGVSVFFLSAFPYDNVQEIKYLLNYLSPLVVGGAALFCATRYPELTRRVVLFALFAWFFTAIVQWRIKPDFLAFLVGPWAGVALDMAASGRGVLSLAPEPTHHAFHMMLLAAAASLLGLGRWVVLLCLVSVLILAKSSNALLVLALGFAWFACLRPTRFVVVAAAGLLGLSLLLSLHDSVLPSGSRMAILLGEMLQDPSQLLRDRSANARLGGLAASTMYLFQDWLMPHGMGFDTWQQAAASILKQFDWLFSISDGGPPSGYGILVFQCGLLAVPPLAIIISRIASVPVPRPQRFIVLSAIVVFLFQFYVSSPMFGFIYAMAIYAHRRMLAPEVGDVRVGAGPRPVSLAPEGGSLQLVKFRA